jgi:hypothetical protein
MTSRAWEEMIESPPTTKAVSSLIAAVLFMSKYIIYIRLEYFIFGNIFAWRVSAHAFSSFVMSIIFHLLCLFPVRIFFNYLA